MAEILAQVARIEGLAMITIRADLTRAGDALAEAAGLPMPDPTGITTDGARSLGWMSPDELLLILPQSDEAHALQLLDQALTGEHAQFEDYLAAQEVSIHARHR